MPAHTSHLRLNRTSAFAIATLSLLLQSGIASAQTVDMSCQRQAVQQRTNDIKAAYSRYDDDMQRATDRLSADESAAFQTNGMQGRITSAYTNFNYEITSRWSELNSRLAQAWNIYRQVVAQCSYYQQYNGGYQYQQQQYSTPSYNNTYTYPTNSYPTINYNNQNPYNYNYNYYPYSSSSSNYTVATNRSGSSSCSACPSTLSPVCGNNGVTYQNACYATCRGGGVSHLNACRGDTSYQY